MKIPTLFLPALCALTLLGRNIHANPHKSQPIKPSVLIINVHDIFDPTGRLAQEPVRRLSQALIKQHSYSIFRLIWSNSVPNMSYEATALYNRTKGVLTFYSVEYISGMGEEGTPPQVEHSKYSGVKNWMIHKVNTAKTRAKTPSRFPIDNFLHLCRWHGGSPSAMSDAAPTSVTFSQINFLAAMGRQLKEECVQRDGFLPSLFPRDLMHDVIRDIAKQIMFPHFFVKENAVRVMVEGVLFAVVKPGRFDVHAGGKGAPSQSEPLGIFVLNQRPCQLDRRSSFRFFHEDVTGANPDFSPARSLRGAVAARR